MTPTIEQVIAAIPGVGRARRPGRADPGRPDQPELAGRRWTASPHFVRIPGAATELLAVDRANERHNTRAAAAGRGRSARSSTSCPTGTCSSSTGWMRRTMSIEALGAPGMPAPGRRGRSRRLHAGPRFRDDFDMFRLSERYLARRRRAPDPRSRPAIASTWTGCRGSRPRSPSTRCPPSRATTTCSPRTTSTTASGCGSSTTSTAATNDPTFELGNTCQELGYDDARVRELCAAYFGEATPALLARMRLQMIMSDVGWTLWAAIQAAHLDDRLRLLRLGRRALGAGDRDARRPRLRALARDRRRLTLRIRRSTQPRIRIPAGSTRTSGARTAGMCSSNTSTVSVAPSANIAER